MATWMEMTKDAPDLAALAEERLTATGLLLLATLRRDGSPRISPIEPLMAGGRLQLIDERLAVGSMWRSTKALDLRRDPRCALHTATADKEVSAGDVKLEARALEVTDAGEMQRISDQIFEETGWRHEVGAFHVFLFDLLGASSVRVRDDVMLVEIWEPGEGVRVVEKRG
ncbi:MAG TPA: pyridoxamine 5'-phosphate oxidase family protein [Acidimicrobiales bacterium]